MSRKLSFIGLFLCLLTAGPAIADNYADCVLDKMPGSQNDMTTNAIVRSCLESHPLGYREVKKGSGRGLFGFKSPDACILKKAKDTPNARGAQMISVGCHCLYGEAAFDGQLCGAAPNSLP